ncbi:Crp/Fnr family transcriptional regulator [Sphingobacterium sp. SGG-5]|uniref:Crp/Fnr family transcriptional regulator n=1 Tax=Sphingobacterium sp. SGG-5 TaxID=2710881 RepID=UPI0013EA718B|nr:Crp/Fnr family transcriptional regulator [Sphingobacterium sp. SGG-5]NGM63070.1 Crp/Fnr family transcriptional regulator [Sphingobacterium sp. SGG-5]
MKIPIDLLLERGATYRKVETGDFIFNEGSPATFYYQLTSGRVRWCNIMDDGREVLHKVVYPGESFGDFPLFDGGSYAASAIADSPCVMLRLSASTFRELLRQYPEIHFKFTESLVADLRFKFMLTNLLPTHSPEEVIGHLIQYFNQQGKLICQDCNRLMMTRQQLANMTGMRVETIIRTIKQMEKDEKLSIIKGKVFIPSDGIQVD